MKSKVRSHCQALIEEHAKAKGLSTLRNPCEDCEAEGKQTAARYANEEGDKDKLCAKHAKAKGLSTLRNPCKDCEAEGKQTAARYANEEDDKDKLLPCRNWLLVTVAVVATSVPNSFLFFFLLFTSQVKPTADQVYSIQISEL